MKVLDHKLLDQREAVQQINLTGIMGGRFIHSVFIEWPSVSGTGTGTWDLTGTRQKPLLSFALLLLSGQHEEDEPVSQHPHDS